MIDTGMRYAVRERADGARVGGRVRQFKLDDFRAIIHQHLSRTGASDVRSMRQSRGRQ